MDLSDFGGKNEREGGGREGGKGGANVLDTHIRAHPRKKRGGGER